MARDKAIIRLTLDACEAGPFAWGADPHSLTNSQRVELAAAAKAIGYRKSVSSSLSLGSAFFVYLSRDTAPRPAKQPGKRWDNSTIARGK